MENNELSKKLIPEEVNQQIEKLEQSQGNKGTKEKDNSLRISEIDKKILEKEQNIKETENKINDIKNSLGLLPSDEIPPSIQSQKDSLGKLNQEKLDIETRIKKIIDRTTLKVDGEPAITNSEDVKEYKELNKKLTEINNQENFLGNTEEIKKFEISVKTALGDISSRSKTMLDALYERQHSDKYFQGMAIAIKNLSKIENNIDVNQVNKIMENVRNLSNLFKEIKIKPAPQFKSRENENNLNKLMPGIRIFREKVSEGAHKINVEMQDKKLEEKSRELSIALRMLAEDSEKLEFSIAKLR